MFEPKNQLECDVYTVMGLIWVICLIFAITDCILFYSQLGLSVLLVLLIMWMLNEFVQ